MNPSSSPRLAPITLPSAPATTTAAPRPTCASVAPPHAPFWLGLFSLLVGFIVTFISAGLQLRTYTPLPFWQQAALAPADLPLWFAAFFSLSVVLSLLITTLLADSGDVRRVAFMGFCLAAYLSVAFALSGLQYRLLGVPAMSAMTEVAPIAAFFFTLAECARGSIGWTLAQLVLYTIVASVLGAYDTRVQGGGGIQFAMELFAFPWELALCIVYFILSGFFRWGALYACQQRHANDELERWWYRVLIFIHLALFWSVFAVTAIRNSDGLETAILYHFIVTENMLLTFTPLALVSFMTLSRSRMRELSKRAAEADHKRSEAEATALARREYIAYIFHEIRVPFSSIVLGLQTLADEVTTAEAASDVAALRASADAMQQILNDTLDVEKMGRGMFRVDLLPTDVREVLTRTVNNFAPWARRERISLSCELDPALPPLVLTDCNRLAQIAGNFISNASKFSPHNGMGVVVVRARIVGRPLLEQPSPPIDSASVDTVPSVVAAGTVAYAEAASPLPPGPWPSSRVRAMLSVLLARVERAVQTAEAALVTISVAAADVALALLMRLYSAMNRTTRQPSTVAAPVAAEPALGISSSPTPSRGSRLSSASSLDTINSVSLPEPLSLIRPNVSYAGSRRVFDGSGVEAETTVPSPSIHPSDTPGASPSEAVIDNGGADTPGASPSEAVIDNGGAAGGGGGGGESDEERRVWLRIEVQDNGVGITAANRARLFKAFVQIEAGRLQASRGTGLGLYICSQIARRLGGRIGCDSTFGCGSCFYAEFPVGVLPTPSSAIAPKPPPTDVYCSDTNATLASASAAVSEFSLGYEMPVHDTAELLPHRALTMLVVDDDATSRMFLARVLRRAFPLSVVEEAGGGDDAVAAVTERLASAGHRPFDVLCLDCEMPCGDGPSAARTLRLRGFTGGIIGITGALDCSDVDRFMASGADVILGKPVQSSELCKCIVRVTDPGWARQRAALQRCE